MKDYLKNLIFLLKIIINRKNIVIVDKVQNVIDCEICEKNNH